MSKLQQLRKSSILQIPKFTSSVLFFSKITLKYFFTCNFMWFLKISIRLVEAFFRIEKRALRDIPHVRRLNSDHRIENVRAREFFVVLRRSLALEEKRRTKSANEVDVYHSKICSGGERATEECRVDKGGNAEEEARRRIRTAGGGREERGVEGWEIERGWCTPKVRACASFLPRRRRRRTRMRRWRRFPYSSSPGKRKIGDRRCARRGRKWRIKELEGVAEGALSTGVFNGNTRRNIYVGS